MESSDMRALIGRCDVRQCSVNSVRRVLKYFIQTSAYLYNVSLNEWKDGSLLSSLALVEALCIFTLDIFSLYTVTRGQENGVFAVVVFSRVNLAQ